MKPSAQSNSPSSPVTMGYWDATGAITPFQQLSVLHVDEL